MSKQIFMIIMAILVLVFFATPAWGALPKVIFVSSPKTITIGESSVLTWTSTNVKTAVINQGIGSVAVNGSRNVSPTATTTYTITVKNANGQKATASVTVTVRHAPPLVSFIASPYDLLQGESSTLSWMTANATIVSIDNGIGNVALNGAMVVTPGETTLYTLTAKGAGGTVTARVKLIVNVIPAPVVKLTASPQVILLGETSMLAWQVQNADSVSIDNGIGLVAGEGTVQVTPSATMTYTVTASNSGGISSASVTIAVDGSLMPTAAIYAGAEIIAAGQSTLLNWTSLHAQSVSIDNGIGEVAPNGSLSVTPSQTTTYALLVSNQNGEITARFKIVVKTAPRCFAYIPNSSDNTVSVVDTANSGSVIKTIGVGAQPRGSAISRDGTRAYIGNASANTISVIDIGSNTVVSTIDICGSPKYLALHPGGGILYATIEKESSYSIAMINTTNGQVLKDLDLGNDRLGGISVHPDGSRLYVAGNNANKLLVIDIINNKILSEIPLRAPIALAVSPEGSRLYAIQSYSGSSDNVSVVNTITQSVISSLRIDLPNGVPASLMALEMLPDGSKLYVSISDNSSISVIDTVSLEVTRASAFAGYSPKCLAANPYSDKVFVLFSNSNYLVFYYCNSNNAGGWLSVGNCPLAFGPFVGFIAETAAGRVSRDNVGVSGVTLTISGEGITRTIVTDANGDFVTALKDGTYTITPSKGNLVFSPQRRQITLDQNLMGIDFLVIDPAVPPTVSLLAFPATISAGSVARLSWTSSNAATASIDNNVGMVPASGSITVSPNASTTYTVTVSNTVLTAAATASVTVSIPPPVAIISASPATITSGSSSTLTWVTINAASAVIDNGIGVVPVEGSFGVVPMETATYTLTATGVGGVASASVRVIVEAAHPTITFIAAPEFIPPGGSSFLTWTTANATAVSINNSIGVVDLSGSLAVSPTNEITYILTAIGPGGTATASVTVKMLEPHLRKVWNEMKTAMISGNPNLAISNFHTETREKYREAYTILSAQLPQIAREMREIEPMAFEENIVIFRLKRNDIINGEEHEISYRIYFVYEDGVWQIYRY